MECKITLQKVQARNLESNKLKNERQYGKISSFLVNIFAVNSGYTTSLLKDKIHLIKMNNLLTFTNT